MMSFILQKTHRPRSPLSPVQREWPEVGGQSQHHQTWEAQYQFQNDLLPLQAPKLTPMNLASQSASVTIVPFDPNLPSSNLSQNQPHLEEKVSLGGHLSGQTSPSMTSLSVIPLSKPGESPPTPLSLLLPKHPTPISSASIVSERMNQYNPNLVVHPSSTGTSLSPHNIISVPQPVAQPAVIGRLISNRYFIQSNEFHSIRNSFTVIHSAWHPPLRLKSSNKSGWKLISKLNFLENILFLRLEGPLNISRSFKLPLKHLSTGGGHSWPPLSTHALQEISVINWEIQVAVDPYKKILITVLDPWKQVSFVSIPVKMYEKNKVMKGLHVHELKKMTNAAAAYYEGGGSGGGVREIKRLEIFNIHIMYILHTCVKKSYVTFFLFVVLLTMEL
ncbi:unnamed protein product [Lepeophtheirus salmonis]|uniref:(salmon louse) hypothetical protein n=1 Tax=Lepeophtheirus salmonis TaxID=72036 RepID=A0A7R8H6V5_LEPSM|nr:unnamed protein product [Lepeophtheirus salmonis]CAF2906886.1 unnamed protein product [Lepeophtheirus salmonis]